MRGVRWTVCTVIGCAALALTASWAHTPVNTSGQLQIGDSNEPLTPGMARVIGAEHPAPDWADLFSADRSWRDVVDEFGSPGANGVPDFLDAWGSFRARRDAVFIRDDLSAGNSVDLTALAASGLVVPDVVPAGDDLVNTYAYTAVSSDGSGLLVYAGVERLSKTSSTSVTFEFNQRPFTLSAEGEIRGERTVGDVRVQAQFTAGALSGATFYVWDIDPADGTRKYIPREVLTGQGCNASGTVCAVQNAADIQGGGWESYTATGDIASDLAADTFFEVGLNLDALLSMSSSGVAFTDLQVTSPGDYAKGSFERTTAAAGGNCMQDHAGFNLNCTANDVRISRLFNVVVTDDGCVGIGDTVTFDADLEVILTAQARYDIGLYLGTDGVQALTGTCRGRILPTAPDPPYVNLDAVSQPTDVCGDIDAAHSPLVLSGARRIVNLTVPCVDTDGDGQVDLPYCVSWRQPGSNDICLSIRDAYPGSPSKCKCARSVVTCVCVDDGNPCTADFCDSSGRCIHPPIAGSCDDGNACTTNDTCVNGQCTGGAAPDCNDNNVCTDDSCDAVAGCVNTPVPGRSCDNATVCDGREVCDAAGVCQPGTPLNCDDGNACTDDFCDPVIGCVHIANDGNVCSDNNACTLNDACVAGQCTGGAAPDCNDGNSCTDDLCNPAVGCVYIPNNTCAGNPRTQGYWKRLCKGPHPSGDVYSAVDVDCVNDTCTFASVQTTAGICARLHPSPSNDKCKQAEAQFMALMLNICRGRVLPSQPISSQCTTNTTVAQSRADADALLCNPNRTHAMCVRAQCESEEINSGQALWTNSLRIARVAGGGIRLTWAPPYATPDFEAPRRYRVWRRQVSEQAFTLVAETSNLTYTDMTANGNTYQYELSVLW